MRAAFVMEQQIGHQTYYLNLRRWIEPIATVESRWVEVTYFQQGGLVERLPLLSPNLRGTLRGRMQVRQGLGRDDADVVFFNTQVLAVLGGRLARRRPYVLATDMTPAQFDAYAQPYGHPTERLGALRSLKHAANVEIFRAAARIMPWSNWVRRSLISDYGVSPERIEVLPPGVDQSVWRPRSEPRRPGPVRVLFVGGDLWRKGGRDLLEAFSTLPEGCAELQLVTRSTVEPRPGVQVFSNLRANAPELIDLYRQADIFVLPTIAEAFGIAAVEAAAAGLPIIATLVGGLPDIVRDGETGYLIAPNDPASLAARLQQLVDDPGLRARLGAAAHAHATLRFNAQANANRLLAVLSSIVQHRGQQCDAQTANS